MRNIYRTIGFANRKAKKSTILVVRIGCKYEIMTRCDFDSLIEARTQPGFSRSAINETVRKVGTFFTPEDASVFLAKMS